MKSNYKLKEITPKEYMCGAMLGCPAIYKVKDITPLEHSCGVTMACPSIQEDGDSYFIIGERINPKDVEVDGKSLEGKVGLNEVLIKIPKGLIDNKA